MAEVVTYLLSRTRFILLIVTYSFQPAKPQRMYYQTSVMEAFSGNGQRTLAVNYLCKKAPS